LHVLSLPPAFVLSQNQTLRLRFDSDETKPVMDLVAAKHLRSLTGNPFTEIHGSRRRSLRTGFPRNANRRCRFGLTRPKSDETRQATPPPAFLFHSQCQTSCKHWPFGQVSAASVLASLAGPVCERAGYKTQSSFPSTAFFELFSAIRRRPKNPEKEPTDFPRAHFGAREKTIWSAGGGDIRPDLPPRKRFLVENAEITRFPQNHVARYTNCGKAHRGSMD
jgi:hypothetical protein